MSAPRTEPASGSQRRSRARPTIWATDAADEIALATFQLRAESDFDHLAHVRVGRLYAQQLPLGAAIDAFIRDLKRFADSKGAAAKFHQTITVAFLLLIRSRLATAPSGESFEAFLARNPELSTAKCLSAFYSPSALGSELARRDFVFPDRAP